jgi:Family of unknown function (DUF6714)
VTVSGPAPEDRERIASRIREAFASVPYPGDDRLVPQTAHRDPEREQIATDFAGRDWRELGVEVARGEPEGLFLMSPLAFRFYLPAYALAAVADPFGSDLVPAAVVQSLTPPPDSDDAARWFEERVGGLSAEQVDAMRDVLKFIGRSGLFLEREAQRALEYWDSRPGNGEER